MSCIEGVCYVRQPGAKSSRSSTQHKRRRLPLSLRPAESAHPESHRGDAPGEESSPAGEACGTCGPSCGCGPCREAHPRAAEHAPAAGIPRRPAGRRPRLAIAPAGAIAPVARPWSMLSAEERRDLYGVAIDRALNRALVRPSGDPVPAYVSQYGLTQEMWDRANATQRQDAIYGGQAGVDRVRAALGGSASANPDALPEWARAAGITQTTWTGMDTAAREAARQRHANASGQGWQTAQSIITQGTAIVNQVLRGDLERDIERIRAQGAADSAARTAAAAEFTARTNLQIAELQAAAATSPANAAQFQQSIQALQAAQSAAQGQQAQQLATILQQMRATASAVTPTTMIVGVGVLGALGLAAAMVLRRPGR